MKRAVLDPLDISGLMLDDFKKTAEEDQEITFALSDDDNSSNENCLEEQAKRSNIKTFLEEFMTFAQEERCDSNAEGMLVLLKTE